MSASLGVASRMQAEIDRFRMMSQVIWTRICQDSLSLCVGRVMSCRCEEREALLKKKEKLGEAILFFGCRARDQDYLYVAWPLRRGGEATLPTFHSGVKICTDMHRT